MEYNGYDLIRENKLRRIEVGDEIVYTQDKLIVAEIRPDGTMTYHPKKLQDGKWIDPHLTREYIAFVKELEDRNKNYDTRRDKSIRRKRTKKSL